MAKPIKKRKNLVSDVLGVSTNSNAHETYPTLSSNTHSATHDTVTDNEIVVSSASEQLIELQTQIEESNNRYLDLLSDNDDLKERCKLLDAQYNTLQIKHKKLVEQKTALEKQILDQQESIKQLTFEIDRLTKLNIINEINHAEIDLMNESTKISKNRSTESHNIKQKPYNINNQRQNRRGYIYPSTKDGYEHWN